MDSSVRPAGGSRGKIAGNDIELTERGRLQTFHYRNFEGCRRRRPIMAASERADVRHNMGRLALILTCRASPPLIPRVPLFIWQLVSPLRLFVEYAPELLSFPLPSSTVTVKLGRSRRVLRHRRFADGPFGPFNCRDTTDRRVAGASPEHGHDMHCTARGPRRLFPHWFTLFYSDSDVPTRISPISPSLTATAPLP